MQTTVWEITGPGLAGLHQRQRLIEQPGPNDVLVAGRAYTLNARDWMQVQGTYDPRQKLPVIPLSDFAGEVLAVGACVTAFRPGDRVVNHALPGWLDGPYVQERIKTRYGGPEDGVLVSHRLFPAHGLLPIPEEMSFIEAACLPVAGLTGWAAVITHGHAKPGDTVVIQGTGGVSLFALQFAHAARARTIVTSSSTAKLERASGMGADHCIDYQANPDWAKIVRELTGGRGADLIVEVAGTYEQSLRAIRAGGTIAAVGVVAGSHPPLDLPRVVMREVRIQGITVGSLAQMEAMLRAMAFGKIKPVIDRIFPFDDAVAAFAFFGSGRHFGKVVIRAD